MTKRSTLSNWLFRELHWLLILCIVLPIIFFALLELTRHFYLAQTMSRLQERTSIIVILVIGVLGFSNLVFAIIRGLQKTSDEQRKQLKVLNEIGLKLASEHQLDDVILTVIQSACRTGNAKYGVLVVTNDDKTIRYFIECTENGCKLRTDDRLIMTDVLAAIIIGGRSILLNDFENQSQFGGFIDEHPTVKQLIGVPIISQSKVVGGMYLCDRKDGRKFNQDDLSILSLLSSQGAVAFENAHIYERLARLSVLEDRQRIAMDLHDGAIQSLYALGLQLESLTSQAKDSKQGHINVAGACDKVKQGVFDINTVIKDLRDYITRLNQNEKQSNSIVASIHEESIRLRAHGINQITIDISPDLSPEHDNQLYAVERGLHECVSNVIRHSEATVVQFAIYFESQLCIIQVKDNGIGVDLKTNIKVIGMGLDNIRARLAEVNGTLELESDVGKGFTISMKIPLNLD